jgi:predicted Zn-dependent protease
MLLSHAGRHAEALAAHRTAVAAAVDDGADRVIATFNLGQALLRAGDAPAAVTALEQVVAREREAPTVPGLLEAAIQALEEARTLAG